LLAPSNYRWGLLPALGYVLFIGKFLTPSTSHFFPCIPLLKDKYLFFPLFSIPFHSFLLFLTLGINNYVFLPLYAILSHSIPFIPTPIRKTQSFPLQSIPSPSISFFYPTPPNLLLKRAPFGERTSRVAAREHNDDDDYHPLSKLSLSIGSLSDKDLHSLSISTSLSSIPKGIIHFKAEELEEVQERIKKL